MSEGFRCWTLYEKEVKRLHQLYDFTLHLFGEEHKRILKAINKGDNPETLLTSIGTISHTYLSLRDYTLELYPSRMRELILVRLVSALEAFLISLIEGIAERNLHPFMVQAPVEFVKSQLLSFSSTRALQRSIIERETRALTSGGFDDIRNYYKTHFLIDLRSFGVSYPDIEELHDRRHLFVHRMGVVDSAYAHKYPTAKLHPGDRLSIGHDYILGAFHLTRAFGKALRDQAMCLFPLLKRRPRRLRGPLTRGLEHRIMMLVRIELADAEYDPIASIPDMPVSQMNHRLGDFIIDIILEESLCTILFGAPNQRTVSAIMTTLRRNSIGYIFLNAFQVLR